MVLLTVKGWKDGTETVGGGGGSGNRGYGKRGSVESVA